MPNPDHIQSVIDRGRGKAARALGGPFNVYRVGALTARNFLDSANMVSQGYPVYHTQKSPSSFRGSYEGINVGAPLFDIVGDMGPFLVGDVFINGDLAYQPYGGTLPAPTTPGGYGAGATSVTGTTLEVYAFCLGFHGPIKKSIGARLDRLAQVFRLPKGTDSNGYWSASTNSAQPLILRNGKFSLGQLGVAPAWIPIGLAARPRWKSDLIKTIPTSTGELEYYCYVPPLPGFSFQESDRIVLQDTSRYLVQLPWEQQVGFVGSQLAVQREVLQG
jgi:hypothetical protein